MKKLLIILLTLFSLSASAQTIDTVKVKVHGGGISESKVSQIISDTSSAIMSIVQDSLNNKVNKTDKFPLNLQEPLYPVNDTTTGFHTNNLPPLRLSLTNRKIDTDTSVPDKKYVDSAIAAQPIGGVSSVNTRTGDITLTKADVGLSNVDNTSDISKPVSTAVQTALNLKANDNAVMHTTGNLTETITGNKTFTGTTSIGSTIDANSALTISKTNGSGNAGITYINSALKKWVTDVSGANGAYRISESGAGSWFNILPGGNTVLGSTSITYDDPALMLTRTVNGSYGGSSHGFVDKTTNSGQYSYASFDAEVHMGASGVDMSTSHYAGFQVNSGYYGTSNLLNFYSFTANPANYGTGTIQNYYGLNIFDKLGTGPINNAYGVYIGDLSSASNSYSIYASGISPSYFGGSVSANSFKKSGGTSSQFLKADGSISSGVTGQTTLVAGTKSITVTGVTTSSIATLGFVSIGGSVSTTWQYKIVCTANTVTITAIDNTGATNTSDTSTLNYSVAY